MRRFSQFKILFRNPRFSNPSPLPNHSHSNLPHSPFISDAWSLWRQQLATRGGVPSTSLGFLTYRLLSRSKLLDFAGLMEGGLRSLKVSLRKRPNIDVGRFYNFRRGPWQYLNLTPDGVVLGLIGVNVAVFLLWRIADRKFMRKHFMISLDNFKAGRLHTLLTSAFSHAELDHLFTNMIGLYFFGTSIGRLFGPQFLLKLYIAGALGGSIFFLLHKALIAPSSKGTFGLDYSRIPGLGASAAVNAIILLDVFLFPKNIYYVNLIIPMPAMLMGALIIGSDLWRVKKGEGDISGSAHLGGAVVAALVWARVKKGWI